MDVKPVFRKEVSEQITQPRITQPYFSKYEYTYLLGVRSKQLEQGAKPMASLEGLKTSDPQFVTKLARREIEQRKLPFLIRRRLPNGQSEYWSAQELEVIW
jgi:DNA-directed RNA polymerases I, II, and III subunit RPABC2